MDEFIKLFGNITVVQIVEFVLACVFMAFIYKQIKKYIQNKIDEQNKRAEEERLRDAKIKEALDAVHKYPTYRKQSLEIQKKIETQIEEIRKNHQDTIDRLNQMEETTRKRERNKIREHLLQNYRYYTNKDTNPSHSWTRMEAEAFWELYREYEEAGGNGYMHTEVLPAMELLTIVEPGVK